MSNSDNLAVKSLDQLRKIMNIAVDYKYAILRKLFHKQAERMTDIVNVLKEVKMVCFNI